VALGSSLWKLPIVGLGFGAVALVALRAVASVLVGRRYETV
jgi:hypothetical protein